MRTEEEVMSLILNIASADERIRAVLLNGSRANPNTEKDIFQDFDIVYIVNEMETFLRDHSWINVFGERIILQMPEEMVIAEKSNVDTFSYLMLFKDGNRIDLTLFPLNKIKSEFKKDSLTILLLDKDDLFEKFPEPDEMDYLIEQPDAKVFRDCCNEFYWVSTYVAKGLWRNEITYAKEMLEIPVRKMFLKIIEWHIGTETDFKVSFGKGGKNMKKYITTELYEKILASYPDSSSDNIWRSLFTMTELFDKLAKELAERLGFNYDEDEARRVMQYLKWVYGLGRH